MQILYQGCLFKIRGFEKAGSLRPEVFVDFKINHSPAFQPGAAEIPDCPVIYQRIVIAYKKCFVRFIVQHILLHSLFFGKPDIWRVTDEDIYRRELNIRRGMQYVIPEKMNGALILKVISMGCLKGLNGDICGIDICIGDGYRKADGNTSAAGANVENERMTERAMPDDVIDKFFRFGPGNQNRLIHPDFQAVKPCIPQDILYRTFGIQFIHELPQPVQSRFGHSDIITGKDLSPAVPYLAEKKVHKAGGFLRSKFVLKPRIHKAVCFFYGQNVYFCSKVINRMHPLDIHVKYMRRCLELARKGMGRTRQNPLVGAVIVHDGRIIGEGYHHEFGGPHAEVNAVNSVSDPSLVRESTLYVNLEPCSHYGKTPPCSLLIREKGIPRVVIGTSDPNPRVSGRGIGNLRESGVEVITGILSGACLDLNRRFFKFISTGKPYVILKWAESRDGFLDRLRVSGEEARPNWITNETARLLVHKWRAEEAGIMAGVNTVLIDNPRLDVRDWTGPSPVRIIIDRNGRTEGDFHIYDGSRKTIVFTTAALKPRANTEYLNPDDDFSLDHILQILGSRGIWSVMVEGGALLMNSFLTAGLWDEARVFTGKAEFKAGIRAPVMEMEPREKIWFRNNLFKLYQRADI